MSEITQEQIEAHDETPEQFDDGFELPKQQHSTTRQEIEAALVRTPEEEERMRKELFNVPAPEPQHSPTPWFIGEQPRGVSVFDDNEREVASCYTRSDAKLIHACVNSYAKHFADPQQAAEDDVLGQALLQLEQCSNKLREMGAEFTSKRFTDRYDDGPQMLSLSKKARALLAHVKTS